MSLFTPINLVFIYSVIMSLIIAVLYRKFSDPKKIREVKQEMKDLNKQMKHSQKKGEDAESKELFARSIKLNKELMTEMRKPLMSSIVLFLIFVWFIHTQFGEMIAFLPIHLPILDWNFPYMHFVTEYNWFWWYILITIPMPLIFRKLLGVDF